MTKKYKIGVIDTETDPFLHMRTPKPFVVQFYAEHERAVFWGDDCIDQLARYLANLKDRYYIFAHNGGKFDFHFMHRYLDNPIRVINSRIVSARMYHHTLRDSFAILPVPLRDYKKDDTDYSWFEATEREKHKPKILKYLNSDCRYLFEAVSDFVEKFGIQLTIGATAMKEIQKRHPSMRLSAEDDAVYRRFYYGGRVQCFKSGILKGPWKMVDVNSSYPKSMRDSVHPKNGTFKITDKMPPDFDKPFFLRFIGTNKNAIPCKADDGSLTFEKPHGEFFACSHELKVALAHGMVTIEKVIECHIAQETISFVEFVDEFQKMKQHGKEVGDKAEELEGKLISNAGYGKYGQDPANFSDWIICRDPGCEGQLIGEGYSMDSEFPDFELWNRPALITEHAYYDVSIAASITSASRALLLEGLQLATDPIYCDTDSIICREFSGPMDNKALGFWSIDAEADYVAIAGKKLYALYTSPKQKNQNPRQKPFKDGGVLKLASKGGTLSLKDILDLCSGKTVTHRNAAPTFSLNHLPHFLSRNFRMTIDVNEENGIIGNDGDVPF